VLLVVLVALCYLIVLDSDAEESFLLLGRMVLGLLLYRSIVLIVVDRMLEMISLVTILNLTYNANFTGVTIALNLTYNAIKLRLKVDLSKGCSCLL
jgi:hypothetical protein